MELEVQQLVPKVKPVCKDMPITQVISEGYDWVQLKWDGWSAMGICTRQGISVFSCGGVLIDFYLWEGDDILVDTILLGEYIGRTNWAMGRKEFGQLAVHDALRTEGVNVSDLCYGERYRRVEALLGILAHSKLFLVQAVEIPSQKWLNDLWETEVIQNGFEGLVYKKSRSLNGTPFGRTKRWISMDYVVMGLAEGGGRNVGRVGSLLCGLYIDGALTSVVSVGGGLTDRLRIDLWQERHTKNSIIGKVIEVHGACLFDGGSMRHPQFIRVRDDKKPEDCVLNKKGI